MWNRKELKRKAKSRLAANYWCMVLVAFIMTLITGGTFTATYKISNKDINLKGILDNGNSNKSGWEEFRDDFLSASNEIEQAVESKLTDEKAETVAAIIIIVVLLVMLIGFAIATCIGILLINPLSVGGNGFFVSNANSNGDMTNLGLAFRHNYMQIVLGMFLKDLFIFAWSLLFVIPGIIKSYEYRMVPYILADNPDIKQRDAFELSKQMMRGNKWRAFVLDISFIGWGILNALTLGLLGIFYVMPYKMQTNANLYLALKGGLTGEENAVYDSYVEMV